MPEVQAAPPLIARELREPHDGHKRGRYTGRAGRIVGYEAAGVRVAFTAQGSYFWVIPGARLELAPPGALH